MTPSERAREIVTKWLCTERNGDASEHPGDHELINDVAMALTIPRGHVRNEHGVDHAFYFINNVQDGTDTDGNKTGEWRYGMLWFSNEEIAREAAEAARGGKQ